MSRRSVSARCAVRLRRAVCETLESRRVLASPTIETPLPRDQRDNYIAPQQAGGSPSLSDVPPGHFEWEYGEQRLVYRFDQPFVGVDNQSHVLTALYKSILVPNGRRRPAMPARY
jgi:hypothetical protein